MGLGPPKRQKGLENFHKKQWKFKMLKAKFSMFATFFNFSWKFTQNFGNSRSKKFQWARGPSILMNLVNL